MCGISGIVAARGERIDRATLQRMNNTLARRGPDDEGYYFDDAGGCGLGHRRLSIIDLAGGHQPLESDDGRVQVIVNGEIYNFREIREELEKKGFVFKTNSDSEVVAHGWVAWGTDMLQRLDGMFAIALWDARSRKLLLARDRMGKKPLYFAFVGARRETLIFASELKALAAHPEMDRQVSPTGLAAYLTYECLPERETIYNDASRILPGHFFLYDRENGRSESRAYWRMQFRASPALREVRGQREDALAMQLRALISEAVRKRLISDVPLGVLLSGGIDSSAVAAAMARHVPPAQIKTFSISFADRSFDESNYARKVSKHLGTKHHEERLSPEVMIDILPEVAAFMCEPLGDASVIPTYLLSRFVRRSVTVALGGDGGDELFLGYPTFQADRVAATIDQYAGLSGAKLIGKSLRAFASLLPVSHKNMSLDFKLKRFAHGLGFPRDHRHQAWMSSFVPEELAVLFTEDFAPRALARDPLAIVSGLRAETDARDALDAAVYQYARLYLTGDVLVKVDRASMACGLEVRAPLLDTKIVEFAAAIPGSLRLNGLTTKYLLKKAVAPWLPREIVERPKKGFGVPIGEWLRGPLRPMAHDLLSAERVRRDGYFDPSVVQTLLQEHDCGAADHRKPLWTLLAFQLWLDRFGPHAERPGIDPTRVRSPSKATHRAVL